MRSEPEQEKEPKGKRHCDVSWGNFDSHSRRLAAISPPVAYPKSSVRIRRAIDAILFTGLVSPCLHLVAGDVTFHRDVLPILQRHCQSCHRPGEAAPFSLLTYNDARPWAKAIREAVLTKKMPPWFADPEYGHFRNDQRLSPAEVRTVGDWVSAGAPEGDPALAPEPASFANGWSIGEPDLVVELR